MFELQTRFVSEKTYAFVQAIDLRSSSDIQGEHDIPPSIGALFQVCPDQFLPVKPWSCHFGYAFVVK
jgi:hypothetical protein